MRVHVLVSSCRRQEAWREAWRMWLHGASRMSEGSTWWVEVVDYPVILSST